MQSSSLKPKTYKDLSAEFPHRVIRSSSAKSKSRLLACSSAKLPGPSNHEKFVPQVKVMEQFIRRVPPSSEQILPAKSKIIHAVINHVPGPSHSCTVHRSSSFRAKLHHPKIFRAVMQSSSPKSKSSEGLLPNFPK